MCLWLLRRNNNMPIDSASFYQPGLGACGIVNTDNDLIVAMNHIVFDAYPGYDGVNCNSICNRPITISYQGKSVEVTVTDNCVACGVDEMQLSPVAFEQLADESEGLIEVDWSWAN
ncbi:barwin-like endoglucanase [Lentinula aff. detonsa]|nr:barwin-like endoglucanase [Lentinula aff. detonsa]